jgi:hypothetical protein
MLDAEQFGDGEHFITKIIRIFEQIYLKVHMEELKVHNYNDDGDSSGCVA